MQAEWIRGTTYHNAISPPFYGDKVKTSVFFFSPHPSLVTCIQRKKKTLKDDTASLPAACAQRQLTD